MTPFESALQAVKDKTASTPKVISDSQNIDYFGYQLASSVYWLKVLALGVKCRNVKLRDLKHYYGLKGRTTKECLIQLTTIKDNYVETLKNNKIDTNC